MLMWKNPTKKSRSLNLEPGFGLDLPTARCYAITLSRAEIAQSVEQGTENPRVPSSILGLGTRKVSIRLRG